MLISILKKIFSISIIKLIVLFPLFEYSYADQISKSKTFKIDKSYLNPNPAFKDYILNSGDTISIRFKNKQQFFNSKRNNNNLSKDLSYFDSNLNNSNYVLDTGDSLIFNFVKTPELNGEYKIDQNGELILPLIKNIYVRGLKFGKFKVLLKEKMKDFLIDPEYDLRISKYKLVPGGKFKIDGRGEILLPPLPNDFEERSRKAYVRGLTINELEQLLEERYEEYFMEPQIFIDIVKFRKVKVNINGEIRVPGFYSFETFQRESKEQNINNSTQFTNPIEVTNQPKVRVIEGNNTNLNNLQTRVTPIKFNRATEDIFRTRLSKVILRSGGLTSYSDISNIKIVRKVSLTSGEKEKVIFTDLTSYLYNTEIQSTKRNYENQNIPIMDGDVIFIPKLQERNEDIVPSSILAGLSPKFISVNVSGNIETSGSVNVPLEASMSDAIDLAGPQKVLSGDIYLIRYKKDGTIIRKKVKYSRNAYPGTKRNPFLLEGDFITVRRSRFYTATETINQVTRPLSGIYLFKKLIDDF
tara:strand:- start:6 stop:1583 length:1578 start_codon:yes stop_codon:yes gene_type:complete